MGGVPPEDYARAQAVLLWGVNPSATSIHLVPHIRSAQRAGAFVAVIDPRRTPLARQASLHLAPQPGTDVVLALAMIDELIRRDWIDHDFIARHTRGFAELARAAAAFPVSRAAATSGVAERDIVALTEAYSAASPAVVRCGWGVERNRNGGNAVRAILSLPAVAGKLGVRGGGFTMSLSRAFPIDAVALARPDLRRRPVRSLNMTQLGRVLTEPLTPPIRAVFVYNANPVAMTPNQNLLLRGFAREDLFTVVHDQVVTDTARYADILLPATTVFEQSELHKSYGHYALQYSEQVIAPPDESLSNCELFSRLAGAMGFAEPELAASSQDLLGVALGNANDRLGADAQERLARDRIVRLRFGAGHDLVQLVTDRPTTRSGKIELAPPELGPLRYAPPPPSAYPLMLLSPATGRAVNSIFGEFNLLAPTLHVNAEDARQRGLRSGDLVRVYNDLGEVHVGLDVDETIRRGVVSLPKGLWRRSTRNGSTSTALVPDHLTDIGAGACFNDARVEVEKLTVGGWTEAVRR
jgi:anaerobic selenocysteine-containing dehydrogenase